MSTYNPNRITTTGVGTAEYVAGYGTEPDFIIDVVPGAREAHDAWQAANLAGREVSDRERPLSAALAAARTALQRHEGSSTDVEAAEAALAAAQRETAAATRAAESALRRFDDLMTEYTDELAATRRTAAVTRTLEKDAETRKLWADFRQAITDREDAWHHAGQPLEHHHWSPRQVPMRGEVTRHLAPLDEVVERFPDLTRIPSQEEAAA